MKAITPASLIVLALAGSSCGGRQAVEIDSNTAPVQNRWNGSLSSPPELAGVSAIGGSGWMGPQEKNADRTDAEVNVSNAVPGGKHPWHVHRGGAGPIRESSGRPTLTSHSRSTTTAAPPPGPSSR
jgi:hypothetical protein